MALHTGTVDARDGDDVTVVEIVQIVIGDDRSPLPDGVEETEVFAGFLPDRGERWISA